MIYVIYLVISCFCDYIFATINHKISMGRGYHDLCDLPCYFVFLCLYVSSCNLKLRIKPEQHRIPVVFHNLERI